MASTKNAKKTPPTNKEIPQKGTSKNVTNDEPVTKKVVKQSVKAMPTSHESPAKVEKKSKTTANVEAEKQVESKQELVDKPKIEKKSSTIKISQATQKENVKAAEKVDKIEPLKTAKKSAKQDESFEMIEPIKDTKKIKKNAPIDPDDMTIKRAKKPESLSVEDEMLVQKIYAEDLDLLPAKLAKKSKKLKMLDLDSIGEEDIEPDLESLPDINESDLANIDISSIPGLQSLIGDKTRASKAALAKEQALIAAAIKNDTMKVYMQDIGQISLVSKEEEIDLAAKIHGYDDMGHDVARNTLILANLRLVVKIAHDFKGLGLPLLDLISEGNIGLMRAVEKFDPAKGAKFSSYAAWWIKQSMRRALANQSRTIRIPVQSAGKINKIKTARMKLAEDLGRDPTDGEIAEYLTFSERTVAGLRLSDPRTFSIHDPIQQGEDGEFQDIIPDRGAMTPDRILGDIESVERLRGLLDKLDEREQQIITMRFGLTPSGRRPLTLEEVSQEIGRTRERVRQIQNQALTKLRELLWDEAGFVNE